MKGSPEEQYLKMKSVQGMHRRVLEAFEDMQSGPNPLAQRDIDALVRKRPQRYLSLATVKLDLKKAAL